MYQFLTQKIKDLKFMKDNLFNLMKDNDWKIFQNFTKKNLVSSFIIDQKFNKFWFKKKKMDYLY